MDMHPLSGALPLPYVLACVTRGVIVDHRHSFAPMSDALLGPLAVPTSVPQDHCAILCIYMERF